MEYDSSKTLNENREIIFEEKEEVLFGLEEKEDELYSKTYNKLASIISFWFFTGKVDKEEFDKILAGQ